MAGNNDERGAVRLYLLGQLTDEQQQQFEQRLILEDQLLEELEIEEDELNDQYLAGQLTDDERRRFEQSFLATPERNQKLSFARALSRYTANFPETADSKTAKVLHNHQANLVPSCRGGICDSNSHGRRLVVLALSHANFPDFCNALPDHQRQ
jgi:hypothetical protein